MVVKELIIACLLARFEWFSLKQYKRDMICQRAKGQRGKGVLLGKSLHIRCYSCSGFCDPTQLSLDTKPHQSPVVKNSISRSSSVLVVCRKDPILFLLLTSSSRCKKNHNHPPVASHPPTIAMAIKPTAFPPTPVVAAPPVKRAGAGPVVENTGLPAPVPVALLDAPEPLDG